jgi:uncharacterized oxidoreductase
LISQIMVNTHGNQRWIAKIDGRTCPEGWLLDHEGQPTTDPGVLYRDPPGTIRASSDAEPFKSFGLGLVAEIFAGALSGGVCARERPINPKGNCLFIQLLDPAAFYGAEEFASEVDRLFDFIRACPCGDDSDEISLPGDRSRRVLAVRRESGVPVDEGAWSELLRLADRLGVGAPPLGLADDQNHRVAANTAKIAASTSAIQ